jgi:hypothetical protein
MEISRTGLEIEDQDHPAGYIGVTITKHNNGYIDLTQHALNDSNINHIHLNDVYTKPLPAKVTMQLHTYKDSKEFSECNFDFNYRSIAGKLNYVGQTTRIDILFATHQVAKYSSNMQQEHGEAILNLVCYLKRTHHLGSKYCPDPSQGVECYCAANFSGNWNR